MAIEFRCPYCTATIRVADSAPGRVGKCPKCNTKMIVPQPAAALPPSLSLDFAGAPTDAPAVVAADDEPILLEENDADVPDVHFASTDVSLFAPIEPAPTALPTNLVPVIAPLGPGRRVIKRKKTGRKRPQVMWLIASVLGLGLSIGAAYLVWQQVLDGRLDGELIGTALEEPHLAPATVPRASLELISSALDPLLLDLEAQPVPLVSELMDVRIGGNKEGLVISIDQGTHTRWYRVDAKSHPGLAKFAAEHEKVLDAPRVKQLDQSAPSFIRDYQKVRKREEDASIMTPYRDSLALNALVKGLGAHTAAVVGRTVYPCVYEQEDGSLFFLLPAKLKSFTLQGKLKPDGGRGLFTGEFRVVVRPDRSVPSEPLPVESKPAKTAQPEMNDEPEAMESEPEATDELPMESKPKKKQKKSKSS
mgnify:CR=1 FL=1